MFWQLTPPLVHISQLITSIITFALVADWSGWDRVNFTVSILTTQPKGFNGACMQLSYKWSMQPHIFLVLIELIFLSCSFSLVSPPWSSASFSSWFISLGWVKVQLSHLLSSFSTLFGGFSGFQLLLFFPKLSATAIGTLQIRANSKPLAHLHGLLSSCGLSALVCLSWPSWKDVAQQGPLCPRLMLPPRPTSPWFKHLNNNPPKPKLTLKIKLQIPHMIFALEFAFCCQD